MSKLLTREQIASKAAIVEAPERSPTAVDRTFELPGALYGATVACYLGFIAVMAIGFGNPGLVLPTAIFVVLIVAGFAVPAMWVRMNPDNPSRPLTWGAFRRNGIATNVGHLAARDGAIQVLILPVLILLWGCAVVTIAALV